MNPYRVQPRDAFNRRPYPPSSGGYLVPVVALLAVSLPFWAYCMSEYPVFTGRLHASRAADAAWGAEVARRADDAVTRASVAPERVSYAAEPVDGTLERAFDRYAEHGRQHGQLLLK